MNSSPPRGFDAVAERYDGDELRNPVLMHMRTRIFQHLCGVFDPGARLIDLGSGTGTDASRLARERNCRVALVDISPRLLERAAAKVHAAHSHGLLGAHLLPAHSVGQLAAIYGRASFDGAYSNLGPLNCEPQLEPVAEGLGELVRPGGRLSLSIMNRWCPAEVGWFAIQGKWREASRRWRGPVQASSYAGGPRDVSTWYYSRCEIERAFATTFRVEHVEALPLLWPPPYLDFVVDRFQTLFKALEPLESWAAEKPILRDLGDHVLIRLRRH